MVDGHAMKVRTEGLTGTKPLLPGEFRSKSGQRIGGRRTKTGTPGSFAPREVSKRCPLPANKEGVAKQGKAEYQKSPATVGRGPCRE